MTTPKIYLSTNSIKIVLKPFKRDVSTDQVLAIFFYSGIDKIKSKINIDFLTHIHSNSSTKKENPYLSARLRCFIRNSPSL